MKKIWIFLLLISLSAVFCGGDGNSGNSGRTRIIPKNAVGATDSTTLRTLDYTPDDTNSIFVSKTGNDTTGTGTQSNPAASINHAISLTDAAHQRIVILDSGTYEEKGFEFTGNFTGLYAALGENPVVEVTKNTDFWEIQEIKGETEFHNGETDGISSTILDNGNIFIVYSDQSDSHKLKYTVINPVTWIIEKTETLLVDTNSLRVSCTKLQNGNILVAYSDSKGKYIVLDPATWSLTKTETIFHNDTTNFLSVTLLNNNNIFIAYGDGSGKFIAINSNTWAIETNEKTFHNGATASIGTSTLQNGDVFITYTDTDDSSKAKYVVLKSLTWAEVVSETTLRENGTGALHSALMPNGHVIITYRDYDNSYKGTFFIFDPSTWSASKTETLFHDANTFYTSPLMLPNGNVFIAFGDNDDSIHGKYVVLGNSARHIKVNTDSTINGVTFTSKDRNWLDTFIDAVNSSLTIKWCDIKSNYSSTSNQTTEAITTNSELIIQNSRFFNNDAGIYAESGKVSIIDSQFTNNTKGHALHINGSAAASGDITINHSDFFSNHSGLMLEGNSGTSEIIKNSIFHSNTHFDISADSSVAASSSVVSGSVSGVSFGTNFIISDPLYINEGVPDFTYIDLNLQTILMGYTADSPAKGLGDDGRNAGSFDVEYVTD